MKLTPRCRGVLAIIANSGDKEWLKADDVHFALQEHRNEARRGPKRPEVLIGLSLGRTHGALSALAHFDYVTQEDRIEDGKLVAYYRINRNGLRRLRQSRDAERPERISIGGLLWNAGRILIS